MEFEAAVSAHLAWKQCLRRILLGRERRHALERTEAVDSAKCPLDAWIRAASTDLAEDRLLQAISEQHDRCHDLAIQMVLGEPGEDSMDMVFRIGQFQMASRELLESLENLRRREGLSGTPLCVIPSGYPRTEFQPPPDVPA